MLNMMKEMRELQHDLARSQRKTEDQMSEVLGQQKMLEQEFFQFSYDVTGRLGNVEGVR